MCHDRMMRDNATSGKILFYGLSFYGLSVIKRLEKTLFMRKDEASREKRL